jgi:hypothetical protein
VQLDSSATKEKKADTSTQEFKFLPHCTFRRWRFGYPTLQHICLFPPSAAGLRPPQAKKLQFPIPFEKTKWLRFSEAIQY